MILPQEDDYTLARQTVGNIIDHISERNLSPGDKLPSERELTEMLSISRNVLREALSILKGMGFISSKHGSGLYICKTEFSGISIYYNYMLKGNYISLKDVFEFRAILEGEAAGLAAQRITEEEILKITLLGEKARENIFNEDVFVEADIEFHDLIAQASGNKMIVANIKSLLGAVNHFRRETQSSEELRKKSYLDHKRIFEAILNHDSATAKQLMTDHILHVYELGISSVTTAE